LRVALGRRALAVELEAGMRKLAAYLVACVAAASAPLVADARPTGHSFAGWPSQLDGRPLTRLADTPEELRFYAAQPTRHARFSDGQRVVLMSWADASIEGFHLAGPCFAAFGFQLQQLAPRSSDGAPAESCFRATRGGVAQRVCEHIRDGEGRTFASMEAWHLAQLLGSTEPPYLGVSIVELEASAKGQQDQASANE
jgi:hypothetical protein